MACPCLSRKDFRTTKDMKESKIYSSCPSYYYSEKFVRPAQIIWHRKYSESGIPPAKAQRRQGYGKRTKTLINDFHSQSPNFAPFASLREILRVSVAAQPHWALRGDP